MSEKPIQEVDFQQYKSQGYLEGGVIEKEANTFTA